ncbi:MAG: alpha/beta hydrolase, partial [Myxococcota bacterium]|nr:alpha/beta hydrolase [Myxococcota bacterium]
MGRSLHTVALVLAGCSAGEDAAPAEGAGGASVSWPAVDTAVDCPVADFTAGGTYALQTGQIYDVEGGQELRLDLYVPDAPGPHPGVVMVHGGGFTSGSPAYMERAARHYASAGFVVLNVEYRRVPAVGLDDLVRDVVCSIRWGLSEADVLGLAPGCVGTMGESAGGYLASMASLAGTDPAFSHGCDAGADVDVLVRWSVPYYGISDLPLFEASGQLGTLMPGLAELADMSVE